MPDRPMPQGWDRMGTAVHSARSTRTPSKSNFVDQRLMLAISQGKAPGRKWPLKPQEAKSGLHSA